MPNINVYSDKIRVLYLSETLTYHQLITYANFS